MRNTSGEVLRAVAAGESFEITNAGVRVARLVPIDGARTGVPIARPAARRGGFAEPARTAAESVESALDDLRGER